MKFPPPMCRACLEAADVDVFCQASDGVVLLYCSHRQVLARITVKDGCPVHWICDHPCSAQAAEQQLVASRRQAHGEAN